jgi:sugar diacid utilization regulator
MPTKNRIAVLVQPRGEILGVLAIVDPHRQVTEDHLFALHFARTLLGYELSHQRSLVEMELSVRRELVDDLIAGTDDDGAFARAEALGHDLHRPHYVVVVHSSASSDSMVATAATRAAAALRLNRLQGRSGGLVVLLTEGRPDPEALHSTLTELMGRATCAIGIGSRCEAPSDFPKSFAEAQRALNVRLHSAAPAGASAYDELGFYRLIDAAHTCGAVEDFIREWLGALLEYDLTKRSHLVFTLSEHLESGGNYDESAKALHIHRSTLRYRLARISELTGYDLRNVNTRFNLHAATRSWRFLYSGDAH